MGTWIAQEERIVKIHRKLTGAGVLCAWCAGLVGTLALVGCVTVAKLTNLGDPMCASELERGLAGIVSEQGEADSVATELAAIAAGALVTGRLGPRPFLVSAPSGTDYIFFVQKKRERCLLRLYGRQKGFVSYTNNLTYIATRELRACECSD
jgi:hypothetical protein